MINQRNRNKRAALWIATFAIAWIPGLTIAQHLTVRWIHNADTSIGCLLATLAIGALGYAIALAATSVIAAIAYTLIAE